MRTLMFLLILATSVSAAPLGAWKATRYGSDETKAGTPGTATGNALNMEAIAHTVVTWSKVFCMTDPLRANQVGAASDADTVWYQLSFVGDGGETSNPSWSIETNINGDGIADAVVKIQGTARSESLHTILVSGNHDNSGVGQLGVADTSGVSFTLKPPLGLDVTLDDDQLAIGKDTFTTKRPKKTTGKGTACRVRIDTTVEINGLAKTKFGHASVITLADLRVDLEMKGYCIWEGIRLEDTFRIGSGGIPAPTASETEGPKGGVETSPETPTDTPAEDPPPENPDPDDDEPDPVPGTADDESSDGTSTDGPPEDESTDVAPESGSWDPIVPLPDPTPAVDPNAPVN